jgi:putative tryptophan/tyrosine transport system substrate-binding protein
MIEYSIARWDPDRLRSLAADMVRRRVRIILADGLDAAIVAKAATETIPIIFLTGGDPVELGLAASFNRPGGNVTGITKQNTETTAKRLDLLHKLVPTAETIAMFAGSGSTYDLEETRDLPTAASILGVRLLILHPRTASEIEGAFATLVDQRAGALLICSRVGGECPVTGNTRQITSLAAKHGIPTMFADKRDVEAGGLASYGPDDDEMQYMVGLWAGLILKGEKPADLPIVQRTNAEFVINLQTAKVLGLEIPPRILALADKVIE